MSSEAGPEEQESGRRSQGHPEGGGRGVEVVQVEVEKVEVEEVQEEEGARKEHATHAGRGGVAPPPPTPTCRICFQGDEQGDLLNPCRCDGSVRHTHQHCLLKWISERGCWTCELCCYRFHVVAINMKRPWQWQSITITLVEKVQIIAIFLGSLFLVASISWLLWSALSPHAVWQRRDILFQICYGMYGFMDLVCVGLIVHEGAAVYNVFLRWRAVNLHWDVQSYDKARDLEDASAGRTLPAPSSLWLPLATLGPDGAPQPSQLAPRRRTCPCLPPCGGSANRNEPGSDGDSGEVVIHVTSV